jgi:peroxiredoxin
MHNLVGQPAVPFTLLDAEGKPYRLDDYRGSWLLMVFHRHLG